MFGGCSVTGPTFQVEMKNYGDHLLVFYDAYMAEGELISPPSSIPPGGVEAFSGNNGGWEKYGTYGCIAWEIGDTDYMLVLYVYLPSNFDLYSNWLGLGIFRTQTLTDSYHLYI